MDKEFINGDFLSPIQLLNNQKYDGHKSLHDEEMADSLGFSGAPIEGCTHLSQFVPLLEEIFKDEWFVSGCISVHYKNMVFEGERVKAFARLPGESKITDISLSLNLLTTFLNKKPSVIYNINLRVVVLNPSKIKNKIKQKIVNIHTKSSFFFISKFLNDRSNR